MTTIPTIPRQTQISLNYWNSTTSTDGCEWETVLQESLWLNAGDSVNVRNSSLDTSLLSNENIFVEEDTYLVFEYITYAMLKKSTMDFQNAANDGSFHDTWIYGKDRATYTDSMSLITDPPVTVNDNFADYEMGTFVNPLWSYVFQTLNADYLADGNFSNNRFFNANPDGLEGNDQLPNLANRVGGWNTGSTIPNVLSANEPLLLVDGFTRLPIKRNTSIVLKRGNYTKAQIAIQITRQLADLQAPESIELTDGFPPNILPNRFQQNQVTLVDASSPDELQNSVGRGEGDAFFYTFQTFEGTALNPFQCEIVIGSDFRFQTGGDINLDSQFIESFNFPNIAAIPPATEVVQKTIPLPQMLNGVVNNRQYLTATGGTVPSIPICFVPITNTFRLVGNNINIINQNPDVNSSADAEHRSWFNDFTRANNSFSNQFDSNEQEFFRDCNQTVNAYQTGVGNDSPLNPTFLPCIMNMDAYWNYSGGVYGTNQFSLLYDPDKNIYSFNFLHTPIITNAGNTEPIPTVVRSRTTATNPYSAVEAKVSYTGGFKLNEESNEKRTNVNERHSGIILTGLTSHYGSPTGADAGFWQKLGFRIEDICLPKEYLQKQGDTIPYSIFMKYTTSELYSISQNINVLNVNSNRNNEQMVVPDTFTMWANPQPQPVVPPAVAPPVPVGFDRDVLYASSATSFLNAQNQPTNVLNDLGGNILIEITGYGRGSELQDVDAFAVKSIVSLFYLTGNTYLSSTGDSYTYYHQSTIPQKISKLKVRLLNPITKKKLTTLLGNNNSVYITVTQNQQITMEGAPAVVPPPKTEEADKGTEHVAK